MRLRLDSRGITSIEMLKSAWEIALEKHAQHEDLSRITAEVLDHVALLEEGWNAIRPSEPDENVDVERPLAA